MPLHRHGLAEWFFSFFLLIFSFWKTHVGSYLVLQTQAIKRRNICLVGARCPKALSGATSRADVPLVELSESIKRFRCDCDTFARAAKRIQAMDSKWFSVGVIIAITINVLCDGPPWWYLFTAYSQRAAPRCIIQINKVRLHVRQGGRWSVLKPNVCTWVRQINSSVCLHQSAKTLKPLAAIINFLKESLANCNTLLGALGSDATLEKIFKCRWHRCGRWRDW